jgi:hypothetical protein
MESCAKLFWAHHKQQLLQHNYAESKIFSQQLPTNLDSLKYKKSDAFMVVLPVGDVGIVK